MNFICFLAGHKIDRSESGFIDARYGRSTCLRCAKNESFDYWDPWEYYGVLNLEGWKAIAFSNMVFWRWYSKNWFWAEENAERSHRNAPWNINNEPPF